MYTKHIKYFNKALIFTLLCLIGVTSVFTSCKDDEEVVTAVILESYGPMPIARGAELKFIGKNLDKVTAIVLPDNLEITTFNTSTANLITITVPQNAVEGLVVLKTPDGDITTKTTIGFSEPISIESFAPASIKAGSELTITGDYLNLVKQIIFTEFVSVNVDAFISQSRKEIKVIVPAEAKTGKIAVSNGAEDPIIVYSGSSLTVTLPAIGSISPNPVKAGTELTISGTNLDLVKSVVLGGNKTITEFVGQSETSIKLTVPADTKDGAVTVIPASGVEVVSASELAMVVPTVSVSPTTVKNGGEITVTGTNLDLIDKVYFGGDVEGTINAGGSSTQIVVTVPDLATSGAVRFTTLASKEVSGAALTLTDPVFTSFSPLATKAKTDITIVGTDLDLVVDVAFTGGVSGTIASQTATELVVTVPVGATAGTIKLIAKNNTEIASPQDITINVTLPVISSISSKGPGKVITVEGTDLNLIKTIYLADADGNYTIPVTSYGAKSDTHLEFYHVLSSAKGDITPLMLTIDGDEGYMPSVYCGSTDAITDATLMISNFDGAGASQSTWGGVVAFGLPSVEFNGTACMLGLSGSGWQWTWAQNWDTRPAIANPENYVLKFDICITKAVDGVSAGMTLKGWDTAVELGQPFTATTNGNWVTMTFDVLTAGMVIDGTGDWGIWINGGDYDLSGIMIDNLRFDPK